MVLLKLYISMGISISFYCNFVAAVFLIIPVMRVITDVSLIWSVIIGYVGMLITLLICAVNEAQRAATFLLFMEF